MELQGTFSRKNLIVPGIFGNILEWYDFALYGYFAPIIAHLFFPADNKVASLLATFGVFAIGFLMRPLGALIFGHFGDKVGRKTTLATAIILMAIPTILIGLLPTHEQIGVAAAALLITCRLLQGLAIGGEFAGSIVYLSEHAPTNRRGLYGSWAMFSAFAGLMLGSGISALMSAIMPHDALQAWGWRLPFLAGLLLGIIGLYLRLRMPETPNFLNVQAAAKLVKQPLGLAFKTAGKPMLVATALVFLPAMGFYLLFVYLSSYMTTYLNIPLEEALTINTLSMLIIIIVMPFIGWLSDRVGRKPVLALGALSYILFSYPLFLLMQHAAFGSILIAQMCFAVLVCFSYAAIPATLVELFATNIRYTAMAFPYNLANAVFGGTAPLVATYLISKTNNPLSPSFYLIAAGIIMLLAVFIIKESYKKPLVD
jgi:MHS family proline/betaine transporter-like MFS transporter